MMLRIVLVYVATLAALLALDAVFLVTVAGPAFRATLGDLLLDKFRPLPAIVFYLAFAAGLLFFASQPIGTAPWRTIILRGAALGFLCYGTYDFTNWATLRPWTAQLVAMDLVWGTFVGAAAATAGVAIGDAILRLTGR